MRLAIIPAAAQQLAQFTAGNIDEFLPEINNLDTARQGNPKARLETAAYGNPQPLLFQLGDPDSPFQDIRLRQAVSLAIDRDALGKAIYNGQAVQTVWIPAYMGEWALLVKDLDANTGRYYKYDPAEAKKLLAAAGASDLQLKFAYIVNGPFSSPLYIKQAEAINSMLNAIGIRTAIVQQDYNKDFIGGGHGSRQGYFDKDMILFPGVAAFTEADEFLFGYFHSKSTSNNEHLKDSNLDTMIDKERTIVDQNERLKAVQDINKYIAGKLYVVSTVGTYRYALVQPRVQSYQFSDSLGKQTETYAKLWLKR